MASEIPNKVLQNCDKSKTFQLWNNLMAALLNAKVACVKLINRIYLRSIVLVIWEHQILCDSMTQNITQLDGDAIYRWRWYSPSRSGLS